MAKMQSRKPARKVVAATGGGLTLGGAVAVVLVYGLERLNGDALPALVVAAIGVLSAALVGGVSGYYVSPSPDDRIAE